MAVVLRLTKKSMAAAVELSGCANVSEMVAPATGPVEVVMCLSKDSMAAAVEFGFAIVSELMWPQVLAAAAVVLPQRQHVAVPAVSASPALVQLLVPFFGSRPDHSQDRRWGLGRPDHSRAFLLGNHELGAVDRRYATLFYMVSLSGLLPALVHSMAADRIHHRLCHHRSSPTMWNLSIRAHLHCRLCLLVHLSEMIELGYAILVQPIGLTLLTPASQYVVVPAHSVRATTTAAVVPAPPSPIVLPPRSVLTAATLTLHPAYSPDQCLRFECLRNALPNLGFLAFLNEVWTV